jgi:hypothetical protein
MINKISGGINITPLISSIIILSTRLSVDKRKLIKDSAKLSTRAPKKILLNTLNVLTYKKQPLNQEPIKTIKQSKPKPSKKNETIKQSKPKPSKKNETIKQSKPKPSKKNETIKQSKQHLVKSRKPTKKMKGGNNKDFFE